MNGLEKCLLFSGIDVDKLTLLITLMNGRRRKYSAGDIILHQWEHTEKLGVIAQGSVEALVYGTNGSQTLISKLAEGDVFADFLAADENYSSPVTLIACEDTVVIHIPFSSVLHPNHEMEAEGHTMLTNLVRIYAHKYFDLKNRLICLAKTTLREKICAVLSLYGKGEKEIVLPFNREQLAQFLNADRSALSRELSKMKADGLIDYRKNVFYVHSAEILEL